MRRIKREDDKGAMGVGTLIVFIAMVLVAAVAASVLIDTANQLQQQAERTGDEAIREVSSSFQVQDVFGRDTSDSGELNELTLKVGLAAGATGQDLNQTVIQIQTNTSEQNLVAAGAEGEGPGSNNYSWSSIIEQEGSSDQYVESGDLYNITIDLENTVGQLGTQADLDINIIPKHGTPTYEEVVTPPTITTELVDL